MPFNIYRTNPVGVVEGKYSKKKRLIVDLSAPQNDENNACLNDMIVKEDFSLNYVTADDAIARIKEKGRGSWLCKTDIKDALNFYPFTLHYGHFMVLSGRANIIIILDWCSEVDQAPRSLTPCL